MMAKHEQAAKQSLNEDNDRTEPTAGNGLDIAGESSAGALSSESDGLGGPGAKNPSGAAYMQTVLAEFAERFQEQVGPVLAPLHNAADVLEAADGSPAAEHILPQLRDSAHQVQVLIDKVAAQQAYVLIFGPLKSGKSTFMNAMCAAYVSEVTCLPAYPCMLYVSPAKAGATRSEFIVTRYDGRQETFTDRDRLGVTVEQAHRLLSDRIREVEQSGEAFDPAAHMPSAIRRVDVKVPAGELEQSGATLVDTPGLYTRMKFGYDRMTRDFRDAAACAIFVVKTDNLFLEQVFDEFNELLELFSRIFLIVNLDSSKQDLTPNG
jgi:GTPase SAR1 family protein